MNRMKYSAAALLLLWGVLTLMAWVYPVKASSEAERRPLAQMPELTGEAVLSGEYMADFGDFSLDQFPLRQDFRTLKSLFHYYVLGQRDNNGIYLTQGHAVQQEYPLNGDSLDHAIGRFSQLRDKYLSDSDIFLAVVPDKGYYLAQDSGQLYLDYDAMVQTLQEGMPWAEFVDLTDTLTADSYYRTDTHWRQEYLLSPAVKLCNALGVTAPKAEDFTITTLERPFYGVYYGQAALPLAPDSMKILESKLLTDCTVYDFETGKAGQIYDVTKLQGRDMYDVFLSGAKSLLTIENPGAGTDRELIVFRDSFANSLVPLLIQDYKKVTLVDIRYIQSNMLPRHLDFHGQDVLFLYSTLVLNNSSTLK